MIATLRIPTAEDRDVLTAFAARRTLCGDAVRTEIAWVAGAELDGVASVVLYSHDVPIAYRAFSGHGGVVFDERPGGRRIGRIMADARRATAAVQQAGCPVETVDHEAFVARCEQIGAGR